MQLHDLRKPSGRTRRQQVGRGGKRGKTSGRGGKGQTARAGNKPRPEWRDAIKKIPKRRGYGRNRSRTVVPRSRTAPVTVTVLAKRFKDGETVSASTLVAKGIVRKVGGKFPPVKILGVGTTPSELPKKLSFKGVQVSAAVRAIIEKAGGTVAA